MNHHQQSLLILLQTLEAVRPGALVEKAIAALPPCTGKTVLLAVGKAACAMGLAALQVPGFSVHQAMILTKYGHADETAIAALPEAIRQRLTIREAGHPIPDAASYAATREALAMTASLGAADRVVLLLSGGGSALFEQPLLPESELEQINRQLLASGADIGEINTLRKRFSAVKAGRFALRCAPAQVVTIALSDVLSNAPDQIASGPACADPTTCQEAQHIAEQYRLSLSPKATHLLTQETPKSLPNATVQIIGGMTHARLASARAFLQLGYTVRLFIPALTCQAQETGRFFAALARKARREGRKLAIVAGGETVVLLPKEHGLGGRNQEMALAAAAVLRHVSDGCFFSLGTDGTDGPTDAAGGWVDGQTADQLEAQQGCHALRKALTYHDAYHALQATGGLVITGPTGTNVNDVCVALIGHP